MKKVIIILVACVIAANSFAQKQTSPADSLTAERFLAMLETMAKDQTGTVAGYGKDKPTYQLFKTTNMWTFLKLNTKNGTITQVQYAINNEN